MRPQQAVSFTIDAFPGRSFEGRVSQIRKAAVASQNVVTYTVVVGFSNPGGTVLPGMTANVRIVTDTRDKVLKVPNAALRVRIAGVEPATAASAAPASAAGRPSTRGRLHGLDAKGRPVAYSVRLGISDGVSTELIVPAGSPEAALLREGAVVVTGVASAGEGAGTAPRSGPRPMF